MRRSATTVAQGLVIVGAVALALAPPSPGVVERWYADRFYPFLQSTLTALSNRSPIALFDVAIILLVSIALWIWVRSIRLARKKQALRNLWRGFVATLTLLAGVYLWFLAAWGLNYARPPLETQIPFDASRVTPAAVRALAEYGIAQANRTHAAGHAAGFPAIFDRPQSLADALHAVEQDFGRPRPTVFATPKWSLLSPFYRASGVSGQLAPFFLETLLNPDLTGPERPAVLAHEWAHLSGYAPEADASFVGTLAVLRSGAAGEYSGWLDIAMEAVGQLQPVTQKIVLQQLADGPRADQLAIYNRVVKARVESVDRVAWSTYDQALKLQGVEEGVKSYSRVIQLLIGTGALKVPTP